MLNIFFISNDKRIEKLIDHFQPFFKTKIRRAVDFDQGLKEVFENRPSLAFIQSTIGTVSGETVARHIKSLLGAGSPRIVFLGDAAEKGKEGAAWCDDWLLLTDSEDRLREGFAAVIKGIFPEEWKEITAEMASAATSDVKIPPGNVIAATKDLIHSESGDGNQTVSAVPHETAPAGVAAEGGQIPGEEAALLQTPAGSVQEEVPAYLNLYDEPFPGKDSLLGRKKSSSRYLFFVICILLIAAAMTWGYFRYFREKKPSGTRVPESPAISTQGTVTSGGGAPPAKRVFRGLPSFVRADWRDPAYSADHPGWERFLSPGMDFRIFRAGDSLAALQVIARNGGAIPEELLKAIVREFGLPSPLPSGAVETKDGFRIERVLIHGRAELVIYREETKKSIRAIVLAFS